MTCSSVSSVLGEQTNKVNGRPHAAVLASLCDVFKGTESSHKQVTKPQIGSWMQDQELIETKTLWMLGKK